MEELIRQIQHGEGVDFTYKLVDFDFFSFAAKHPKLTLSHGVTLMDMLAKVYLQDFNMASAAAVPFMLLASRFIESEQAYDLVMKIVEMCISALLTLEKDWEQKQADHAARKAAEEAEI